MQEKYSLDRNMTEEFARRVRKNLDFIINKRDEGEDVHEVTQLVISLLGVIVFPWEAHKLKYLEGLTLAGLEKDSWPHWDILQGEHDTETLGDMIRHLRNAAAHQNVWFSSDSREMGEVRIEFADRPAKGEPINWRASINAVDLRQFCDCFVKRLVSIVG